MNLARKELGDVTRGPALFWAARFAPTRAIIRVMKEPAGRIFLPFVKYDVKNVGMQKL